jgi:hypothetical protein
MVCVVWYDMLSGMVWDGMGWDGIVWWVVCRCCMQVCDGIVWYGMV